MMDLTGRSAIVTGGAGGLGAATARHLVALGVGVAVFDLDGERAHALAGELGSAAVAVAVAVAGSVTEDEDVQQAIDAGQALGTLSILVNVAGGGVRPMRTVGRDGTPHSMQAFIDTVAKNTFGTFNVTRLAGAAMAANEPDEDGQRGVVINTGSAAAYDGQVGQVPYAAAKAAILGMSLPMARDLGPVGIRVCGIAPGTMGTDLMRGASPSIVEPLLASLVFPQRMGRPHEFALLVEAIVKNPYLNGENIRLDAAQRFPAK